MPRIHTITTDTVLSDSDMLLGTDGAAGANNATKNFSFGVFKNFITSNVTFTGNTFVTSGDFTIDNNKFLKSSMANGTSISLIGIDSSNNILIDSGTGSIPVKFGVGLVTMGGNLQLTAGDLAIAGNYTGNNFNDSNWNAAFVFSQVGLTFSGWNYNWRHDYR